MTISVYSESPSPLGTSIYRFDGVTAPAQFLPTAIFTAKKNPSGSNVNVHVNMAYPLPTIVDGTNIVKDSFLIDFRFTALQSVTATTERARILDEFIAFLTANKPRILAGSVRPVAP